MSTPEATPIKKQTTTRIEQPIERQTSTQSIQKPNEEKQKITGFCILSIIAVLVAFIFYILFFTSIGKIFITQNVNETLENKMIEELSAKE